MAQWHEQGPGAPPLGSAADPGRSAGARGAVAVHRWPVQQPPRSAPVSRAAGASSRLPEGGGPGGSGFLVSEAGAGLGAAREPPAPHAAASLSRLASCHCKVPPVTFELGTCVVLVSPPRSLPERPLCKKPGAEELVGGASRVLTRTSGRRRFRRGWGGRSGRPAENSSEIGELRLAGGGASALKRGCRGVGVQGHSYRA